MSPFERRSVCPRTQREKAFQAAWEELVSRYDALLKGRVRRSLRAAGLLATDELVEERVQEVYYRLLLGGAGRLRLLRRWSERRVVTYLARAAQRVVLDEARSQAAVKRGGGWGLWWDESVTAVDPRGTPEEQALLSEQRRLVLKGCHRMVRSMMPSRDRGRSLNILRLALLEGWSSPEIVRAVGGGLSPSTVDTMVHRARRRLAQGGLGLPDRRRETGALISSPP
jgi:DNA-directed RNA polymerase specialized sigma24 family protein